MITLASSWTFRARALVAAASLSSSACSFMVPLDGLAGGGGGSDDDAAVASVTSGAIDAGLAPSNPKGAVSSDAGSAPPPPSGGGGVPDGGGAFDGGTLLVDSGVDASVPDSAPPSACSKGLARVFVTSSMSTGDLGGVAGADALCQQRAAAQAIGGTWKAWLSDSSTSAAAHIAIAPKGYVLVDGTVVAASYAALLTGTLSHAIDETETGTVPTDGLTEVWTGIDVTGGMGNGGFCDDGYGHDWTSSDAGSATPLVGHLNAADSTWSAAYLQLCNRTDVRLYCFESCL